MNGELRIHHILTLAHLLSKGAKHNYVTVTTSSLGHSIKRSQQAASQHMVELERNGFIERIAMGRKMSVRITASGLSEVARLSSVLQESLELADSPDLARVKLAGVLVSGMGEGAYYMTLDGYTRQFKSKVGYIPFPGTLNIQLTLREYKDAARRLRSERAGITIESFSDKNRTYGSARCFPALMYTKDHRGDGIPCDLIVLERTHHDDSIVELISKVCLRESAKISDGSELVVEILPE